MAGVAREQPLKVVIINTEYVETDARSFKSVVQKLTGKDSTTTAAAPAPKRRFSRRETKDEEGISQSNVKLSLSSGDDPFFVRNVSFKEPEGFLRQTPLPPVDDLYDFWG